LNHFLIKQKGETQMFTKYLSEELYQIRDACDRIEQPVNARVVSGLCMFLTVEPNLQRIPANDLVDEVFKPQSDYETEQFGGKGFVYYFMNFKDSPEEVLHTRILAAGFLACLIDDELISRGD